MVGIVQSSEEPKCVFVKVRVSITVLVSVTLAGD